MIWYVAVRREDGSYPDVGTDGRMVWHNMSELSAQAAVRRMTRSSGATIHAEGYYDDRPYADRPVSQFTSRDGRIVK